MTGWSLASGAAPKAGGLKVPGGGGRGERNFLQERRARSRCPFPPEHVDVIMVAPKGSGTTVRSNFLEGRGINSSYAVYQDATGRALERTLALGVGIGSGYLFPTTFEREVLSDLTGERGVLMGAIAGIMKAQYNILRRTVLALEIEGETTLNSAGIARFADFACSSSLGILRKSREKLSGGTRLKDLQPIDVQASALHKGSHSVSGSRAAERVPFGRRVVSLRSGSPFPVEEREDGC